MSTPLFYDSKSPNDDDYFGLNWALKLGTATIATASVVISPSGSLTANAVVIDPTQTIVATYLSGGTAGVTYLVTQHVTTSDGRVLERSGQVYVEQR